MVVLTGSIWLSIGAGGGMSLLHGVTCGLCNDAVKSCYSLQSRIIGRQVSNVQEGLSPKAVLSWHLLRRSEEIPQKISLRTRDLRPEI